MGFLSAGVNVRIVGIRTSSQAFEARRTAVIEFQAAVDQTLIDSGTVSQDTINSGVTTTTLETGIATVVTQDNTGTFASVAVPDVTGVTATTVTVVTAAPTASTSGDDDTGLIVGVVIGGVIFLALVIAGIVFLTMKMAGSGSA